MALYKRRIWLAVVSHRACDNLPGLLPASAVGNTPLETALQMSRRYCWSALKSVIVSGNRPLSSHSISLKLTRSGLWQSVKLLPSGPKNPWRPDVFPSNVSKTCRSGSLLLRSWHITHCNGRLSFSSNFELYHHFYLC